MVDRRRETPEAGNEDNPRLEKSSEVNINFTDKESKPDSKPQQGKPEVKPQRKPQQKPQAQAKAEEIQDPDRLLLGKQVLVRLFDGTQFRAMVMNMGRYWVVFRVVLDNDKSKTLIVNKAFIAYYEVVQ
jgi:hypothetical protein